MTDQRHKHVCPECGCKQPCQWPDKCAEHDTRDVKLICPGCALARGRGETRPT